MISIGTGLCLKTFKIQSVYDGSWRIFGIYPHDYHNGMSARRRNSDNVNPNSPDGLPGNPWPVVAIASECNQCGELVTTEECPHCGTTNAIDYENDYGEKEYEPDDEP